jgi:hypothetical protein
MRTERLLWLTAAVLGFAFWWWRAIAAPLPFFSFQSDPELAYFFNAVLLANGLPVEHTDHPGTALQWIGALIARGQGIGFASALEPAVAQRFFTAWRVLALLSAVGTGWMLSRKLRGKTPSAIAVVMLGFALDYQSFVYWPTFTPESAFFVIYVPVALACVLHGGTWSLPRGLAAAVAMGFVTTIKLTLWPVTLFVAAGLAFTQNSGVRAWARLAAFVGVALFTYVLVAMVSAQDPAAQWRWVGALIGNSGRYGAPRAEGGFFPPLSLGFEALRRGFALQSYTVVPAAVAILVFAVASLRRFARERNRAATTWSVVFLAAASMSLLLFFKHPYQFKYLMPVSVLTAIYLAHSATVDAIPAHRWSWAAALLMAVVALNALAAQNLLYDYVTARDQRVQTRVDRWIATVPHDAVVFSAGLPHPIAACKYTMPVTPGFTREFERKFGRVELAEIQIADFQRIAPTALRVPADARRALAFLATPLTDSRWHQLDASDEDHLYVYVFCE